MSLSISEYLQVSTKRGRTGMQTGPDTRDCSEEPRTRMVRLTVNLPTDLADRMRDAVYWTPGLTLAWFVASAIRTSLTELETFNRVPFPRRARQLRPGRPRLMGQSLNLHPRSTPSGTPRATDRSSPLNTGLPSNRE